MKYLIPLAALTLGMVAVAPAFTLAPVTLSSAVVSQTGSSLDRFHAALKDAQSLQVTLTLTPIGQASSEVKLALQKPNRFRLEVPGEVIVGDGTTITRFIQAENAFIRTAQNEASVRSRFIEHGVQMYLPFFGYEGPKFGQVRDAGTRKRQGKDMTMVRATSTQNRTTTVTTFYIDPTDRMVKGVDSSVTMGDRTDTLVTTVAPGAAPAAEVFAYTPPTGSREIKEEDMVLGKFITDLELGKRIAKTNKKLLMIHFTAVWCGPCQMMAREVYTTNEFKQATKDMVLVKIDIDEQGNVAQQYQVSAIPTMIFLDNRDNVIVRETGGLPLGSFLNLLNDAKSKFSAN
jgi:thioredoxin 1